MSHNNTPEDRLSDQVLQRLGSSRLRHIDFEWSETEIYAAELSPDGTLLASASEARKDQDWTAVGAIDLNPTTGSVQIWDAAKGELLLFVEAHDSTVLPMTFCTGGRFLCEGANDGSVRFWNLRTLQPSVHLQGLRPEFGDDDDFSIGDRFSIFQDGNRLVAANHMPSDETGGKVEVWDLESGTILSSLNTAWQPINSVRLAAHDSVVILAFGEVTTADDEEAREATLIVWDFEKNEVIHRLPGEWFNARLSDDGLALELIRADKIKRIEFPSKPQAVIPQPKGNNAMRRVVVERRALTVVDPDSLTQAIDGEHFHNDAVVLEAKGHADAITDVVALPDGIHLVTSSMDGRVCLWNWHTGELVDTLIEDLGEQLMSLALSPNGGLLAVGGTAGIVTIYNLNSGFVQCVLPTSNKTINTLLFADPDQLIVGDDDCAVTAWKVSEEARWLIATAADRVDGLAIVLDPPRLLVKSTPGVIAVFDLDSDPCEVRHVFGIRRKSWSLMAVSPDGTTVIVPEIKHRREFDGSQLADSYTTYLRRWNTDSGEELPHLWLKHARVFCLRFSPDGRLLALGDREGRVTVINYETGALCKLSKAHKTMVTSLAFLDNNTLASGSCDTTIAILRIDPAFVERPPDYDE